MSVRKSESIAKRRVKSRKKEEKNMRLSWLECGQDLDISEAASLPNASVKCPACGTTFRLLDGHPPSLAYVSHGADPMVLHRMRNPSSSQREERSVKR